MCGGGGARSSWQKCLFEFTIKIGSIFPFSVNYQLSVLCGLYTFVLYLNYVAVQLLRLSEVLQIATSSVSFFFFACLRSITLHCRLDSYQCFPPLTSKIDSLSLIGIREKYLPRKTLQPAYFLSKF